MRCSKVDGMISDNELYRLYLDGNVTAYDELMVRLGDALTAYLFGYLENWQDAENLMIEAFARIMVKRPLIREGNFKAYLYKTARNLAARHHAAKLRMETVSLDELSEELQGTGELPESAAEKAEEKETLLRCMGRVAPELRDVLWLLYYEEMSYDEAGAVLGVSKKRIDHLAVRARKELRKELEKEGLHKERTGS